MNLIEINLSKKSNVSSSNYMPLPRLPLSRSSTTLKETPLIVDLLKGLKADVGEKDEEIRKLDKTMKDHEKAFLSQIEDVQKHELNERRKVESEK